MDDGSEIKLKVEIDCLTGKAVFDFTGTAIEVRVPTQKDDKYSVPRLGLNT